MMNLIYVKYRLGFHSSISKSYLFLYVTILYCSQDLPSGGKEWDVITAFFLMEHKKTVTKYGETTKIELRKNFLC
jgi:hypothetical protein